MNPTATINRLHFEDLEPRRFEELGYNLLARLYNWKRLDHTGVSGNDGGIDIYGITADGSHCYCQVKRYQKLVQSNIRDIFDAISENNKLHENSRFILICACDLNAPILDAIYSRGKEAGFQSIDIFSRTRLESLLYNDHRPLLKRFFGSPYKNESKIAKMKKNIRLKKLVNNQLIRKDLNRISVEKIAANPSLKFITDEFMLLSSISSLAAERYGEAGTFFRAFPIDSTDEGIDFALPLFSTVIFNLSTNTWRKKSSSCERLMKNEYELQCQQIGRLPYYQIVDIERDGDSYYSVPIIHCQEDYIIDVFNKIRHRHHYLGVTFELNKPLSDRDIHYIHAYIETNLKN